MDKNKVLATLCLSIALSGCGDWKQNPLDGKSGNFDKGRPVPTKPDLTKPIPTDSVFIETPSDFHSTEEGMPVEFPITGRVALEGYTAEVKIENLEAFPGATYDPITGIFRWTPEVGFVQSTGTTKLVATANLRIVVFGHRPDHQVLYNETSYPVAVYRGFNAPEVLSVTKPAEFVREGSYLDIPVEIYDKDALVSNSSTWPTLNLHSIVGEKSLAGLVSVHRTTALGGNKYSAVLRVNLTGVEVTDSIALFKMGLVASSRFGQVSAMQTMSLKVYTSFNQPVSTWDSNMQGKVGVPMNHTFLINDPKMEAKLSVEQLSGVPENANLSCRELSRGVMTCNFSFTPTDSRRIVIRMTVKMQNHDVRDTQTASRYLEFRTTVLPRGS